MVPIVVTIPPGCHPNPRTRRFSGNSERVLMTRYGEDRIRPLRSGADPEGPAAHLEGCEATARWCTRRDALHEFVIVGRRQAFGGAVEDRLFRGGPEMLHGSRTWTEHPGKRQVMTLLRSRRVARATGEAEQQDTGGYESARNAPRRALRTDSRDAVLASHSGGLWLAQPRPRRARGGGPFLTSVIPHLSNATTFKKRRKARPDSGSRRYGSPPISAVRRLLRS
jgi:hypothetical protein